LEAPTTISLLFVLVFVDGSGVATLETDDDCDALRRGVFDKMMVSDRVAAVPLLRPRLLRNLSLSLLSLVSSSSSRTSVRRDDEDDDG
jgi:hypothetical protein